jgi:hypothetical protein
MYQRFHQHTRCYDPDLSLSFEIQLDSDITEVNLRRKFSNRLFGVR